MMSYHNDDGGSKLFCNISQYIPDHMVQQPRRWPSLYLLPLEPGLSSYITILCVCVCVCAGTCV
jgi:hypothetical protein